MIDFILFWLRCLGDAFTFSKWVLSFITFAGFVLWLYYGRKHEHEHEGLRNKKRSITTAIYWVCFLSIPLYALFVAPYSRYSEAQRKSLELTKQVEDTSPKLDGVIDQTIAKQIANTNILIFQVSIANAGRLPSMAEAFRLSVISTNSTNHAHLIDISDTYKQTIVANNKTWALALKRSELIAEKTVKAIQPGDVQRGWIAFTLTNLSFNQLLQSTMVLSFMDILGRQVSVTNGYWHGKHLEFKSTGLPINLPGSDTILSQVDESTNRLTWMPPELPVGCTNVTIYFGGSQAISCPLAVANISPEEHGTKFSINELPDFLLKDLDKTPGYSPRMENIWYRWQSAQTQFGSTVVNLPFVPYIISNRFYLYVEVPFQRGKHRLIMSEDFDSVLSSLPRNWDRNFHTNFCAYEIVNEHTNPVLQVAYLSPNEIVVNGLFIVNTNQFLEAFWHPPQLMTMAYKFIDLTNMEPIAEGFTPVALGTNSVGEVITNAMYNWTFPSRKAWFKYPSNRNRSVFADDFHVLPNP